MHWLADENDFEAAKESPLNESYIQENQSSIFMDESLMDEIPPIQSSDNNSSIGNFDDGEILEEKKARKSSENTELTPIPAQTPHRQVKPVEKSVVRWE